MKNVLFALTLLLSGCSSPPPPATPVKWTDYNAQANNDKQISLEGYLRLPVTALVNDTMLVELHENSDAKGKPISVSLKVGSSKNQIEKPPEKYSQSDMKVHANDGNLVDANQKVRVAGKFIYSASGGSIFYAPVDIQKI